MLGQVWCGPSCTHILTQTVCGGLRMAFWVCFFLPFLYVLWEFNSGSHIQSVPLPTELSCLPCRYVLVNGRAEKRVQPGHIRTLFTEFIFRMASQRPHSCLLSSVSLTSVSFKKNRTFFFPLSTFFILERLDFCVIIEKRWKSVWNNSGLLGILAWYLENLFLVHDFRSKFSVNKDQHLRLGAVSPSQPPQRV